MGKTRDLFKKIRDTVGKLSTKQPVGGSPWENGEGPEVPQLGAAGRKTSSAFGYAQRQDLIINIKDVA